MCAKAIMFQGTGSDVGKSILTTALCRILHNEEKSVVPFKAQNMSLNSYITQDGYEIGRAQAVQAEASGLEPTKDMNPILLKPASDTMVQVIIHGKVVANYSATEYQKFKTKLGMTPIKQSYNRLNKKYSYIIIEGAGSPAEINLKKYDLVNMRTAELAGAPVILVGDINRGGVFASFVGTMELLDKKERNRIAGFIINKFRGDASLLKSGIEFLEKRTGKPVLGVIPYIYDIGIDEEDSINEIKLSAKTSYAENKLLIDVLYLPHISNFTDFEPLEREPDVHLRYITRKRHFIKPDILIIPGSKNTIDDMAHLNERGYKEKILELYHSGVMIIGICGGYQMLGKEIRDPYGVESNKKVIEGFDLLPFITTLNKNKITTNVTGEAINVPFYSGEIKGYEIHMGETKLINKRPYLFTFMRNKKEKVNDGISNENFLIWGTYLHGIFDNDEFRKEFLNFARTHKGMPCIEHTFINKNEREKKYNQLADIVQKNLKMDIIYKLLEG